MSPNHYRKGVRAEYRTMAVLEKAGYYPRRTAGSHGVYDVVAISPTSVRIINVKTGGAKASPLERESLRQMKVPSKVSKELWRWPDRSREPLIEVL